MSDGMSPEQRARYDELRRQGTNGLGLMPPLVPTALVRSLPPIYGEGIIPPRVTVPPKVTSSPLEIFDEALAHADTRALMAQVDEKLRLEDERIRRLLPALPAGYSWRGEIEYRDHVDFYSLEVSVTMRIVYRLHGPDGERLELSAREAWARADAEG